MLKQGLCYFSCLFMPSPAVPGVTMGALHLDSVILPCYQGTHAWPLQRVIRACQSKPSALHQTRFLLVRSFPNLISTLKAISMVVLLPLSFFNVSVGQIIHVELEMAAPFPRWKRNAGGPRCRSVLFAAELGWAAADRSLPMGLE